MNFVAAGLFLVTFVKEFVKGVHVNSQNMSKLQQIILCDFFESKKNSLQCLNPPITRSCFFSLASFYWVKFSPPRAGGKVLGQKLGSCFLKKRDPEMSWFTINNPHIITGPCYCFMDFYMK